MLDRYALSRGGSLIERAAIDNNLWLTLVAIHFVSYHYLEVGDSRVDLLTNACQSLLRHGVVDDATLASMLLCRITDHTHVTQRDVQEVFGSVIAEKAIALAQRVADVAELDLPCLNGLIESQQPNVALASERYPFGRDMVFLERLAIDNGWWSFLLALHFANKQYWKMKRDDGSDEIEHSASVCCGINDRGVATERRLKEGILHDILENTIITSLELERLFGKDTRADVERISKKPEHKASPAVYFDEVFGSPDSAAVKAVDQERVVSNMIQVYLIERMERKIQEIRQWILPRMKDARNKFPELKGLFFSSRYLIRSVVEGAERYCQVARISAGAFLAARKTTRLVVAMEEDTKALAASIRRGAWDEADRLSRGLESLVAEAKASQEEVKLQEGQFSKLVKFENSPLN
ncbi:hypothetical protein EPO05_01070 [Patescibacteria group bacterium]|nr:MAG: hypothetical protein EPO05_01070 [Patescibacteria group bacterium]